jgi:predicted transcriptional regulator
MGHDQKKQADISDIVASFAGRPDASVDQIVDLYARLNAQPSSHKPVSEPENGGGDDTDALVSCLVCGKGFKMLKRHLRTAHGLSEMEYRVRFGLREEHPLVAPEYSRRKAEQARLSGLGQRLPDQS